MVIECKSLSSDWEKVSAYLGLPFKLIDTLKRDNLRDSTGCWNEALKHWIKQNFDTKTFGRPSWRSLLRAVAKVDHLLFEKLAAKHSQPSMLIIICARLYLPHNHIIMLSLFVASSDEPESNNSPKDGVAHVQGTSTIDYIP